MEHGGDSETVRKCCALAAPTGCASFHMKYGASTCHRLLGLPAFGYVGRLTSRSKRLPVLKERLKGARALVLDEFSMLGKVFMGKMLLRARDIFGSKPAEFRRDVSMGGLDVIVAGHSAQAQPIGDDSLCKVGPYTGRGRNQPKDGVDPTAPSCEDLSNDAELFMKEFEDVTLLRRVWRLDDGTDDMSPEEREAYRAEADKFLEVLGRMADLEWTPADHAWLQQRRRSVLEGSERGRQELAVFEHAPILMDRRQKKR